MPTDRTFSDNDYCRWRPRYHPLPAKGWVNDPCAVGYDPRSKQYHLGFQWNPNDCEWGNIAWGSAFSSDMLHWNFTSQPILEPSVSDSPQGVFTGCMIPCDGREDQSLVAFYTSVYQLPIHWKQPYIKGSERLHMAISNDSGRSWKPLTTSNPVLHGPPEAAQVTGWRDPFVAPWPNASRLMSKDKPNDKLWGIISGGIRNSTPTTFLYRISTCNLTEWEYIGPLIELGLNFTPSRWSHDFGTNWEVVNFISLHEKAERGSHDFLVFSAEGRLPEVGTTRSPIRHERAQMFICGELTKTPDDTLQMKFNYGGVLDYGAFYAGNSFWDPVTKNHILWGWIQEDDLPLELHQRQGWAGTLSLPRVIKLVELHSIECALASPIHSITSMQYKSDGQDPTLYTLQTLIAVPDSRIKMLRGRNRSLPCNTPVERDSRLAIRQSTVGWDLEISFTISSNTKRIGIVILHSEDEKEQTMIYFAPQTETLHVDRSRSTSIPNLHLVDETARHTLFRRRINGKSELEPLALRVLYDASILEIFACGRTAITTRVYPNNQFNEIRPFVEYELSIDSNFSRSQLLCGDSWELIPRSSVSLSG